MEIHISNKWRFVPVYGKRPIWSDWVNRGVSLSELPVSAGQGVGLLLGHVSGGIVALDFDGQEAWDFFAEQFGLAIERLFLHTVV